MQQRRTPTGHLPCLVNNSWKPVTPLAPNAKSACLMEQPTAGSGSTFELLFFLISYTKAHNLPFEFGILNSWSHIINGLL
jgi:hypothetical protein